MDSKLKAVRAGHKSAVKRLLRKTEDDSNLDNEESAELLETLIQKQKIISALDEDIMNSLKEEDIEEEILNADEYKFFLNTKIRHLRKTFANKLCTDNDIPQHDHALPSHTFENINQHSSVPYYSMPIKKFLTTGEFGLAKVDLVIILDSSTSVREENYDKMKHFTKDLLVNSDIDGGNVRVGAASFSMRGFINFQLKDYRTKNDVFNALDKIQYIVGSTNTADAIRLMRVDTFTADNGDRPDVKNIAIIITDGVSNVNAETTIPEAEKARDVGIHIYAIGIGLSNLTELHGIASVPAKDNSLDVQSFDELKGPMKILPSKSSAQLSTTTSFLESTTNALLSNTTFFEESTADDLCQGETLNITCPNYFIISFDDANFGRGHLDSERCSQFWGTENLCQDQNLTITCPNNFVISFDDANFGRGRSDSQRCREWLGIENTHCDNHKQTLKVFNDKCKEQQKCSLPVNKATFGNPCVGVTKYLNVKYHCKRKVIHGIINEGSPCAKHILTLNLLNVKSHERHHCLRPVNKYTLGNTSQSTLILSKAIHSITTSILTTHYDKQLTTNPSILTTEDFHHYPTKEYVKKETKEIKASMDMIIVVSALVSISIAASVTITFICYQRHKSKHSLTRSVRQDQIITERVDSSDYTAINYNEMTDMSLPETNENYYENNTTPREPQSIINIIEKTGDTLTVYESLSNNQTSVEHVYELESTQNN
ncbi:unnamed protein product [Mytilus edulis]|uniref:VWFA domain-containing protein n=1 Tax=Mytilus edulis TaxID=6550 RepID=A0A8S3RWI6_MYTED|nr:unnamed protein product [Mytilus edulis]